MNEETCQKVKAAITTAAAHRPSGDDMGACPVCSMRAHERVSWPCEPYVAAREVMTAAGVPRPVA